MKRVSHNFMGRGGAVGDLHKSPSIFYLLPNTQPSFLASICFFPACWFNQ